MTSLIRKLSRRFTFGKGDDIFDDLVAEGKSEEKNDDDEFSQPTATQLTRKKSIFQRTVSRLSMSRNAEEDGLGTKKKRRFSLFNLFGGESKEANEKESDTPESPKSVKNKQTDNIKAVTSYFSNRGTLLGGKKAREPEEDEEAGFRSPIPTMKQQKKGSIQRKGEKKKSAKISGRYTKRSLKHNVLDSSDMLSSYAGSNTKRSKKPFSFRGTGISKNEAKKHASLSLKSQNQVLARELPVLYQTNDTEEQKDFYNIENSPEETFSFTYKTTTKREIQHKSSQKQSQFTPFLPQKVQEDSNLMFDVYSASASQLGSLSKTSRKSLRGPLAASKSEPLSLDCDIVLGKGQIIFRFPDRMSKFYCFEIGNLENIIYAPNLKETSKESLSFSLKFLSRKKGDNADDSLFTFIAETQEDIETFIHGLFIEIEAQTNCYKNVLNELVGADALKLFLSEDDSMDENIKQNVNNFSSQIENLLRTVVDLTHLRVGLYHPESAELQFALGNYLKTFRTADKASEISFWLELSQVSETKFAIKNNPRLQAGFDDADLLGLEKLRHQATKDARNIKAKVAERDLTTRTEAIVSWLKYTSAQVDESDGEVQALDKEDLVDML
eukprot:augustus_masked-scaffold_27-processed-gene-2.9-mRNA-1 protein AED:1.00 eAED:1.00 QI:0/-1/0/0/-1/1/1/0/610